MMADIALPDARIVVRALGQPTMITTLSKFLAERPLANELELRLTLSAGRAWRGGGCVVSSDMHEAMVRQERWS